MEWDIPADRLVDGRIALFTFTTAGFAPFTRNLHASLRRHDPALADKLIVFCADDETAQELATSGAFTIICDPAGLPAFVECAAPGFARVVSYKFALARTLLRQVEHAWWCDGDIVARGALGARMTELLDRSDADLLMQHEWPKDLLNTGFWVARRSEAVDEMLTDMIERTAQADGEDQGYFNERHGRSGRLTIARLDHDEFACGNRFYYRRLIGEPEALLLHFNFSFGRGTKKALMQEHGSWYLEQTRSTALGARARRFLRALGLRLGIWLVDDAVPLDDVAEGVTGPRRRLLLATRSVRRRLAGLRAR